MSGGPPHRVCLLIRDGWGYSAETEGNAIAAARTPNTDRIAREYYSTLLSASGTTVGLPEGEMGNSEVGHLTMGAGRSEPQELMRIEKAIADGSFGKLQPLVDAISAVKGEGKDDGEAKKQKVDGKDNKSDGSASGRRKLHLLGLISDGGVHSHIAHVFALLQSCKDAQLPPDSVYVHFITDGRDTPPTSAPTYVKQLRDKMSELGIGRLADLIGRHYAMDRDHRWERVQAAYDLYTQSKGEKVAAEKVEGKLAELYESGKGVNDQNVPALVVDEGGRMEDGDVVVCFNFRNDRAKEITGALARRGDTSVKLNDKLNLRVVSMVQYDEKFDIPVLFPFHAVEHTLPYVVSEAGLKQFHVAETEKYAHVTFFFSGGKEEKVQGETRRLLDSPKVETYDQQPEMSMRAVGDEVVKAIEGGQYELIVCNVAASDMVGHTGAWDATVKACEVVDEVVGAVVATIEKQAGERWVLLLTGDHGNAEEMLDDAGQPKTSHTTNPVQLHIVGEEFKAQSEGEEREGKDGGKGEKRRKLEDVTGGLNDVAPTIIELLGLKQPKEMTGKSLLLKK